MCSVSFLPQREGFVLAMNRDEQLTRPRALPPDIALCGTLRAVFPREPSGGTWIGANESGVAFALVNWYSHKHYTKSCSRGEITPRLLGAASLDEADSLLHELPAVDYNPFRLLVFDERAARAAEWRAADSSIIRRDVAWSRGHWFSSGLDESEANRVRSRTCLEAESEADAGSLDWLRRLHRSHAPECGPFSLCMHRKDARTVSYTEIVASHDSIACRYTEGNPCSPAATVTVRL